LSLLPFSRKAATDAASRADCSLMLADARALLGSGGIDFADHIGDPLDASHDGFHRTACFLNQA
jgi:hypothetical protein